MSGTGKSSSLFELRKRGYETVDTDDAGWSVWSDADGGYVWNEQRIDELLDRERSATLYVSGTVSNQGRFYARFDAVVLLSAPADVLIERIERRATNDYAKTPHERELILEQLAEVEPLLRATCTHEIDTARPLDQVVAELAAIAEDGSYLPLRSISSTR
jgi:dephospho-CoA kinase